tara:strand:- start:46 stop:306 length:261 start_codon:yes stop_codon:yes gene_type:complete
MSRSIIELALKVLKRGTSLTYQDELIEREQAIKGLEDMLKREWVGLTEPELHEINPTWPAPGQQWDYEDVLAFARSIEAKLKEKNT